MARFAKSFNGLSSKPLAALDRPDPAVFAAESFKGHCQDGKRRRVMP
jgi:hypothetical protein